MLYLDVPLSPTVWTNIHINNLNIQGGDKHHIYNPRGFTYSLFLCTFPFFFLVLNQVSTPHSSQSNFHSSLLSINFLLPTPLLIFKLIKKHYQHNFPFPLISSANFIFLSFLCPFFSSLLPSLLLPIISQVLIVTLVKLNTVIILIWKIFSASSKDNRFSSFHIIYFFDNNNHLTSTNFPYLIQLHSFEPRSTKMDAGKLDVFSESKFSFRYPTDLSVVPCLPYHKCLKHVRNKMIRLGNHIFFTSFLPSRTNFIFTKMLQNSFRNGSLFSIFNQSLYNSFLSNSTLKTQESSCEKIKAQDTIKVNFINLFYKRKSKLTTSFFQLSFSTNIKTLELFFYTAPKSHTSFIHAVCLLSFSFPSLYWLMLNIPYLPVFSSSFYLTSLLFIFLSLSISSKNILITLKQWYERFLLRWTRLRRRSLVTTTDHKDKHDLDSVRKWIRLSAILWFYFFLHPNFIAHLNFKRHIHYLVHISDQNNCFVFFLTISVTTSCLNLHIVRPTSLLWLLLSYLVAVFLTYFSLLLLLKTKNPRIFKPARVFDSNRFSTLRWSQGAKSWNLQQSLGRSCWVSVLWRAVRSPAQPGALTLRLKCIFLDLFSGLGFAPTVQCI
ncbi:hypothetical protein VP01_178g1 [Puccinia sorghi]|uniref:Uncharacterized protein n=1 Tax=Puccinia sorghi TaxID=27349 RepID=A0A0L6VF22_9BASI|nr:hypothetical protein VP01_178g1 [Puccinia sorghi]